MLIKAGSGLAGTAKASSAGISKNVASETIVLESDKDAVEECLQSRDKLQRLSSSHLQQTMVFIQIKNFNFPQRDHQKAWSFTYS